MATNMESTYALRKAALARMAQPSSVAAQPDLGEIAGEHAAARGKIAAESAAHARDVSYAEKSLAEKNRQFYSRLDLDREQLETWGKQNRWATALMVANLGIQALAIPAALRQEEKQEKDRAALIEELRKPVGLVEKANERRAATQDKALGELKAAADYNRQYSEAIGKMNDPETLAEIAAIRDKTTAGTRALQAADREYFPPGPETPDLLTVARRRTDDLGLPVGGMPVWYKH